MGSGAFARTVLTMFPEAVQTSASNIRDEEIVLATLALETSVFNPLDALKAIKKLRNSEATDIATVVKEFSDLSSVITAVATELGISYVDLFSSFSGLKVASELFERTDIVWLERLVFIPLMADNGAITVATAFPFDPALNDYLSIVFPEGYTVVLASSEQILQMILSERSATAAAGFSEEASTGALGTDITPGVSPVLTWIEATLSSAIAQGASDLHFEITIDSRLLCRFRIDGSLVVHPTPLRDRELEIIAALLSRASMDSSNVREPQDGSFSFMTSGRKIDVRASMVPLATGPKLVLRVLDPDNLRTLEDLGFGARTLAAISTATKLTKGLVVVAGPTGSGKTTTLYAMLREIADVTKNVMTVENPIEYRLPLISQIPVRDDLGIRSVTFERALRSILRLDPDIILVGEIRDKETAKVAIEAALTGHLVLTTTHAAHAVGVYTRLIEMGLPPYLVAEALTLSMSQRLARKLHSCATYNPPTTQEIAALTACQISVPAVVFNSVGCAACSYSGYRGRVAVSEVITPTEELRKVVTASSSADFIKESQISSENHITSNVDLTRLLIEGKINTTEAVRLSTGSAL